MRGQRLELLLDLRRECRIESMLAHGALGRGLEIEMG
jgi:hypothetical protein